MAKEEKKKAAKTEKPKTKKKSIIDMVEKLKGIMETVSEEATKFEEKGVAAAGTRARVALQEIRKFTQEIRKAIQENKNKNK
jgi:hypothetical protein